MRHNDAAIDSGFTTHTWPLMAPVKNIQKTAPSVAINVKLPNDQIMAQSHHGNVPSFKCPEPTTGHIKNDAKKDTRGGTEKEYKKNDDIRR